MNPKKELLWGLWVYYCRVLRIESSGVRGWGFRVYVVHGGGRFLDLQNKGCLLHGIVLQKLKVRSVHLRLWKHRWCHCFRDSEPMLSLNKLPHSKPVYCLGFHELPQV